MLNMFKRADDKGFTLIELLIVIAIIGILAAIAVPIFLSQSQNATLAAMESEASSLNSLVGANISINGTVGTIDGAGAVGDDASGWEVLGGSAYAGAAGTMNTGDATLSITYATEATMGTTYCATATDLADPTIFASYGPGC